jgi:hypothetical protein
VLNAAAAEASDDNRSFTINYAKRSVDPKVQDGGRSKKCGDKNVWRIQSITLHSNDKYIVKEWHDTLNNILSCEHADALSFQFN